VGSGLGSDYYFLDQQRGAFDHALEGAREWGSRFGTLSPGEQVAYDQMRHDMSPPPPAPKVEVPPPAGMPEMPRRTPGLDPSPPRWSIGGGTGAINKWSAPMGERIADGATRTIENDPRITGKGPAARRPAPSGRQAGGGAMPQSNRGLDASGQMSPSERLAAMQGTSVAKQPFDMEAEMERLGIGRSKRTYAPMPATVDRGGFAALKQLYPQAMQARTRDDSLGEKIMKAKIAAANGDVGAQKLLAAYDIGAAHDVARVESAKQGAGASIFRTKETTKLGLAKLAETQDEFDRTYKYKYDALNKDHAYKSALLAGRVDQLDFKVLKAKMDDATRLRGQLVMQESAIAYLRGKPEARELERKIVAEIAETEKEIQLLNAALLKKAEAQAGAPGNGGSNISASRETSGGGGPNSGPQQRSNPLVGAGGPRAPIPPSAPGKIPVTYRADPEKKTWFIDEARFDPAKHERR